MHAYSCLTSLLDWHLKFLVAPSNKPFHIQALWQCYILGRKYSSLSWFKSKIKMHPSWIIHVLVDHNLINLGET